MRERYWYRDLEVARWEKATPEQARRARMREEVRARADNDGEQVESNLYVWTFHSLRHVAARFWVFDLRDSEGGPIPLVSASQHLGHASTDLTERQYVGGQRL